MATALYGNLLPVRNFEPPTEGDEADLAGHVTHLKSQGYTILRSVLSDAEIAETRARLDLRMAAKMEAALGERNGAPQTGAELAAHGSTVSIGGPESSAAIGFPGLLAAAPEVAELLIKPFLLSPRLLDLAERIMGPFVQGDGFYVVGTPPPSYTGKATGLANRTDLLASAAGFHRDAYSHHKMWRNDPGWADDLASGGQPFTSPLAMHMLCYLQDMDGPGGALMVVPGSHRSGFGNEPSSNAEKEAVLPLNARGEPLVSCTTVMLSHAPTNLDMCVVPE